MSRSVYAAYAGVFMLLSLLITHERVVAEPYLAVQQGYECVQCHVNPTGGGMRSTFGNVYAQNVMPARTIKTDAEPWTGAIGAHLRLGADLRAAARVTDTPGQSETNAFELDQARVYAQFAAIPERMSVYLDQLVAPGAATTREAYARYWSPQQRWYAKAGRLYLPFGWRLQDDSAFVRQASGINMTAPDTGVEIGWEAGAWSAQFAATNGSGGGAESDDGKAVTAQAVYTASGWRIGAAGHFNNADAGDRTSVALFAGVRTGPVAWLAEIDYVDDDIAGAAALGNDSRSVIAGLLEANWRVRQGHNVKLTAEGLDPNDDVDEDHQARWSLQYEYTPIQFIQLRGGARVYDGIPQNDLQNRRIYFVEVHGFF